MKVLLFLASSLLVAHAFSIPDKDMEEWKAYKIKYSKSYSEAEDKFRMKVFMDKKLEIAEHNARYEKGEVTFTQGVNQFSDMLYSEILEKYNVYNGRETFKKTQGSTFIPPANDPLPDEVDWVKKGAVTPVRDQGNCGSCWAFSATGSLEGQHFNKTGKLVTLSVQNLVDCSGPQGNHGCHGGYMEKAFQYIKENKGINTEESYPYKGRDETCKFNPNTIGATITDYVVLPFKNETALQVAVATVGPISVIIGVTSRFSHYTNGIFFDPDCYSSIFLHAVLVVGYGTDKETNEKYWLIKNSWGETWGQKGYGKMLRGKNICAISNNASYPVI